MQIDEKGLKITSLDEFLDEFEQKLQGKYGSNFHIKPEGVIDNIAATTGMINNKLQAQIAELAKQFDPETAAGKWQDALYERIGVTRIKAQKTTFSCNILGEPNLECAANSITLRSKTDKNEFTNTNSFSTDDSGIAIVDFQCLRQGSITVNSEDEFEIVTAPDGIYTASPAENLQVSIGRERETDDEFRIRYRNSKALNAKATRNANEANLSKYVDNIAFLKIIDKKNDESFEPGTLKIIAHHNTTDNVFARGIFDTIADGIELIGDTEISVTDDSNQPVTIKFKNADIISINIMADVKIRKGYYANSVFSKVKNNILAYIDERIFGLEATIYATEFIIPILETEGVEAVKNIKVKRLDTDEEYLDSVSLTNEQVPEFKADRIVLNEDK